MKIIVGLGNPGEKYQKNRHNVGFMFVEHLLETCNLKLETLNSGSEASNCKLQASSFKKDKYMLSEVAKLQATSSKLQDDILLAKPQTFMNRSGDAVKKLIERQASSFKFQVSNDLIVVHDDLDIPFGKFKIQTQGPKAHNGLTDIQNKLRTMDFLRIRIGVDNRPIENRMNGEEYVLQNFLEQEALLLPDLFNKIEERFMPFLQSENAVSF